MIGYSKRAFLRQNSVAALNLCECTLVHEYFDTDRVAGVNCVNWRFSYGV